MGDRRGTEIRRPQGLRYALLLGCAGVALVSGRAHAAGTLPSGGHFVAGTGGIATTGGTTTVTQSSSRGIVNWKNFSIGKGNKVQFDNGSGATLNRVTGGSLSTIAGQLKATGSVYLINQNGVVVAPGGKIVTGGSFVASTRDTTDSQFMAGGNQYFSGTSRGAVVNDGAVVSQTGSVVLIGHAVTNSGTIDAAKGTAALAAGNRVLMTDTSGPDRVYVAGKSGDTTNDGQVRAAAVELASAGGNVYALAGNRDGLVRATGTRTVNGQVWLTAPDGTVDVEGRVVAKDADGTGGAIYAKGASLKIADKAVLNAAGKTGKGRIMTSGDKVSIGKARVTGGQQGKWTIDPTDLTIDTSAANTISATLEGGTAVVEQTTATGASGNGTQTSGAGDINVIAPISWSSLANLTLDSFHSINISALITISGGGDLFLNTNNNVGGASSGGTLNFVMGQGAVHYTGGSGTTATLTINGSPYTLIYDTGASATGLQSLNGSSGNFALAVPLDATSLGTLGNALIPSFSGTFNGLGNTVSNLTVASVVNGQSAGMFGSIGASGVVTNIGIVGGSFSAIHVNTAAGTLAGVNSGTIVNAYATGTVLDGLFAGGLVGDNEGTLARVYAAGSVNGNQAGGLVGISGTGTISDSYATGAVTGDLTGGFVGTYFGGTISSSYATGKVSGTVAGGFIGTNSSFLDSPTNCYWDITTSGTSTAVGAGSAFSPPAVTGLTTAQLAAGLPAGFSPSIWANVNNKTTPYLSINPGPVIASTDVGATPTLLNLIFTPTQLQAINSNPTGNFALANDIDMTAVTGFTPIGETTAYTGTFNGLGNVVANLTITLPGTFGGLFGQIGVGGTVKNVGLIGGSVTVGGGDNVGALAGFNQGTIFSAYASGVTVTGGNATNAGGLVGTNAGSITDAYASGSVKAAGTIGGLVGLNQAGGMIVDAYATGPATGDVGGAASFVGGLVGANAGTVSTAYAIGLVTNGSAGSVDGGVFGNNSGTITNTYWNTDRTGLATNGNNTGTLTSVTGLSGAAAFTLSSYAGFVGITTPGVTGNAWVIVDTNGSLNNNGGVGATMPMLVTEYSTTIETSHQLQLADMDVSKSYTLARDIDATATKATVTTGTDVWGASGFVPIGGVAASAYGGTFDGAGHTISNLTMNSALSAAGLFRSTSAGATIRNLSLVGVSITDMTANASVGGLVGDSFGSISNVHVSGTVTAGNAVDAGGLAGTNNGAIANSYAQVAVSVDSGHAGGLVGESFSGTISTSFAAGSVTAGGGFIGGLVGDNDAASTITDTYAVGAVTNTAGGGAGGLVGFNSGTIIDAYATGAVTASGGSTAHGLVAANAGTVTDGYWDSETTGQTRNVSGDGTQMTTAQLQSGLPTFVNPGNWDIIAGISYPFLKFQFGGATPQVVSGTVYADGGTTNAGAGVTVSGIGSGSVLVSAQTGGAVVTGANGFYYYLIAPSTVPVGGSLLTYATYGSGGATKGAAFADVVSYTTTGMAIYANTLHEITADTTNSALTANRVTAESGFGAVAALVNGLPSLRIDASGAFAVDLDIFYASGTVTLNAGGAITEGAGVGIAANTLTGSSAGNATFDQTNKIANLGAFSTTGGGANGNFTLVMNNANIGLDIVGTVNAGTGTVSLTNVSAGSPLVADIMEQTGGAIIAGTLTGSASGSAFFQQSGNLITNLGAFTETHNANFSFINSKTLNVSGVVNAGTTGFVDIETTGAGSNLTVNANLLAPGSSVALRSAGTITQSGGVIIAAAFGGNSVGGATLTQANQVGTFGSFANTGSGDVSFTDTQALATTGTVSSAGNLTLTTTGVGSTLTLGGDLTATGHTITFTTTGAISQTAGIVTAGTLTGTAAGDVTLDKDNKVSRFAFGISGGANADISLTDTVALTLADQFSTNNITVTTKNGAGITVTGTVHASANLTLNSAGRITESGAGFVETGGQFSGSSVGGATLGGNNLVASFANFTNSTSGNVSFTNTAVDAPVGGITSAGNLTLTGPGLKIQGNLTVGSGRTVTLISTGQIAQTGGIITAGTLTGSSTGNTLLNAGNRIDTLSAFTAGGAFSLLDFNALTTTGNIIAGNGGAGDLDITAPSMNLKGNGTTWTVSSPDSITLTTISGDMALGAFVSTPGTLSLGSAGKITENTSTGSISAGTLTGGSTGGTNLSSVNFATLDNFTNSGSGDLYIADTAGSLTVTGAVSTASGTTLSLVNSGTLRLTATSSLTAAGSGGVVALGKTGGGSVTQAAGSVITAGMLQGQATGGVSLVGANKVMVLGPFTNGTSGDFAFTDARSFATAGTVSSANDLTLTAGAGDSLTVRGALTAQAVVRLDMSGKITQSAGSVITTSTLTGSSVGGATLTGANHVGDLGTFTDTGAGNATGFSFTDAQAMTVIGTVRSTGPLALTTTVGDLVLDADVTAPRGAVTLNSAGEIRQAGGVIDPGSLLINSVGNVSLTNANTVDTIAARITGAGATLTFNDTANNLTIGTVGGVSGVQTNNGDITLRTTTSGNIALNRSVNAGTGTVTVAALGNLAIGAGGSVSAGGGATLAAQGNFANAAGAGAITVGAGSRWLVYSTDPSADTDGGLTPNFIQYAAPYNFGTLTGTAPATTGNGFLYSLTPAALTLTGVTKTYDGTTGLSGASFTASGAMAGDTVTLGGSPTGSFAGKNAGTGIDVTVNGLAVTATHGGIAVYGYTVASVTNDPIGTIDPKTVTAGLTGTVTKVYDGTTAATLAAGNYTLTGIIAGDAVSLNDPTSGTYASPAAGTGIAVTVNGVALTGAEAGNYRLAATTLTAGIGTITPTVVTPPPPPPPPPHVVLPPTPFIPVQPPQPAQQAADPGAIAAAAHALVVPTPELADLARLSGCSGGDFVAVVPGEDGHVGAVVIEAEGNKTVLHAAYAGCSGSKPVITSPQEVNRLFGGALAARPTPPVNFEVYYNTGSARLEPDALAMLDKAFAEIARRKPVDVVVTGFTDTVGTPQGNDLLSLARAQQVTKLLLARGLMPGAVATFGRGQRDPQVPTPAQVAEEKNRRVEITVR